MRVQLYGGFMDGQTYELSSYLSEIRIPIPPDVSGFMHEEDDWSAKMNNELGLHADVLYPDRSLRVAVYKEFARGQYKLVDSGY